jgi:3-hydroxy-9,10-secoandrosta-1,3,5(10)-triene-9,17-dione monooxygenase
MQRASDLATGVPEAAEIVARARALIPALAARSREGRRARRIPDATIADMQRAGLFRVLQPKRWGGYEMDLHTFYEVELALGEGDMSTA